MKKLLIVFAMLLAACAGTTTAQTATPVANGNGEVVIWVVRHGKTMLNTTDRVQGWSDAVLTPAGVEVAEFLGEGLKDAKVNFVAAYSSDSGRSVQTANIILEKMGLKAALPLKTDWRFREFNFGTYEGDLNHSMWAEIAKRDGITLEEFIKIGPNPESFANSVAAMDKGKSPDGVNWPAEDYATITTRLVAAANDLAKEMSAQGGGNVLLVSHGLSIAAMVNSLVPEANVKGGIANASVSKLIYKDGKFTVESYGDMSYVQAGQKKLGK